MRALAVDILSWALILGGSFFTVVGMAGLIRMPELFTRLHAASVTDTLGLGLLCAGLILQAGPTLVAVKLLFIVALVFFTGPVITHALAQAALHAGVVPSLAENRLERAGESSGEAPQPARVVRADARTNVEAAK